MGFNCLKATEHYKKTHYAGHFLDFLGLFSDGTFFQELGFVTFLTLRLVTSMDSNHMKTNFITQLIVEMTHYVGHFLGLFSDGTFFQELGFVTFLTLRLSNFMQKSEKN